MDFNFLSVMAYLIVTITLLTMIFGIVAYIVYKMREARRAKMKQILSEQQAEEEAQKERYLFFEEKEIQI